MRLKKLLIGLLPLLLMGCTDPDAAPVNWTNATAGYNLLSLVQTLNTNLSGTLAIGFLGAFYIIMLIATSYFQRQKSILATSYVTTALSVLFLMANLIGWQVVGIFIILTIASYIIDRD